MTRGAISKENPSLITQHTDDGWAGHSRLGYEPLGSAEEVLSRVRDKTQKDIFKRIYVWTTDEDAVDIPLASVDSGRVSGGLSI